MFDQPVSLSYQRYEELHPPQSILSISKISTDKQSEGRRDVEKQSLVSFYTQNDSFKRYGDQRETNNAEKSTNVPKPKQPLSAYFHFTKDIVPKIRQSQPELTQQRVVCVAGIMWKDLP